MHVAHFLLLMEALLGAEVLVIERMLLFDTPAFINSFFII